MTPINAIASAADPVLSNVIPALKNVTLNKLNIAQVRDFINTNTPNKSTFENKHVFNTVIGFNMNDNSGKQVFMFYFTIKNDHVVDGNYETSYITTISGAREVYLMHKSYFDKNYIIKNMEYSSSKIKELVMHDNYDIGDGCHANLSLIQGTDKSKNADIGYITIRIYC